ncbi:uncharacterized protein LOC130370190 isoform X3 [Gadus chalcogrammus]|uniref:uncharacterized protein LOC130370190 isoform X3 n=1 Tax=Gadus chalcogrammus TaxID=1042646 RepID=UPI0024C48E23|nr:uncharacterized protein LOC130370190 isoform X3 [Gadus chalcogrammus]
MGMCPKQRAGLRQHLLLYTPANLLAIETLLQFKQVDCEFSLTDIRASPANRMTRAVLSILVIFVCLAPMLEVNSTQDDHKNAIEAVELSINFLKEHFKFKIDAQADKLTEQIRVLDGMLDVLQNAGPEYSAVKKQFEASKETSSELKAKWLLNNENSEFIWESIRELFKVLNETEVNKDEL